MIELDNRAECLMVQFSTGVIRSVCALRDLAGTWDDLHARSGLTLPVAKAGHLALWCDHFAPRDQLRAIVVYDGDRLVGALSLIDRRWLGISVGSLAGNAWSGAGEILLDPEADVPAVCRALVSAMRQCGWPLVRFDAVPAQMPRWQAFWSALDGAAVRYERRPRFAINVVRPGDDWDRYFASRSRAHRRRVRRAAAKANADGETKLVCYDALAPDDVEPLLERLFAIEASGWKGREGTAVLMAPAIWDFYRQQARHLAADGELNLVVLEHTGRAIAFEYGLQAGGAYYSPKVGYDESFATIAPGQLLRAMWLERIVREGQVDTVDYCGPASPATSSWATDDYPMECALVSTGGAVGQTAVELYRRLGPAVRSAKRWLGRSEVVADCRHDVDPRTSEREESEHAVAIES
jgi:CelD/BcsL family acetyltransferase involved in cellulose biosynthesis